MFDPHAQNTPMMMMMVMAAAMVIVITWHTITLETIDKENHHKLVAEQKIPMEFFVCCFLFLFWFV